MAQIKEEQRRLVNIVAGQYLVEQEDGDYYDAYLKLRSRVDEDETNRALLASDIVDLWEGAEDWTVEILIDMIESGVTMYEDIHIPAFIQGIDWSKLKEQKDDVLAAISNLHRDAKEADSVGEDAQHDDLIKLATSLEGIIGLIDGVQDYAVDVLKMNENNVFNFKEDLED